MVAEGKVEFGSEERKVIKPAPTVQAGKKECEHGPVATASGGKN